jgi:hypothetical protein
MWHCRCKTAADRVAFGIKMRQDLLKWGADIAADYRSMPAGTKCVIRKAASNIIESTPITLAKVRTFTNSLL